MSTERYAHLAIDCDFGGGFAVPRQGKKVVEARAPYSTVHVLDTCILDDESTKVITSAAFEACPTSSYGEIKVRMVHEERIGAGLYERLMKGVADALAMTQVAGDEVQQYRQMVEDTDFITCEGAHFHNDVHGGWESSLFWVLALDVPDVEFVMPHAGVRVPLVPGRVVVFDPALVHGLCRPGDGLKAVPESFDDPETGAFAFLGGELLLGESDWVRLGSPWRPAVVMQKLGLANLAKLSIDERTGAILNMDEAKLQAAAA